VDFEKKMYEIPEKWAESYLSVDHKKRIEAVHQLIPGGTRSILDVGCGNGILVNYLQEEFGSDFVRICGTDRSEEALSKVKTEKYLADIVSLPFRDDEFEVITCLEVIEHLPHHVYQKALDEMARIASKCVIVSVPYSEDLEYSKVSCVKCRTDFNPYYHMRSFDSEKIKDLYSVSTLEFTSLHLIGKKSRPRFRVARKWITKRLNPNSFPNYCICPMCGYNELHKLKSTDEPDESNGHPIKRVIPNGTGNYWPVYKEAIWIAGLYSKKDGVKAG
jgi:ubiquinone/menaquinone biosynthesis C-methylase UbiE